MSSIAVSVLDLLPVRTGQTSTQALQAARSLARVADDSGARRYWLAEHHNTLSVASTNPPVAIALLAAATTRLRIGSGGVMLPNHAPLVVAEQFALLEAAFPGRIDLGIGRAPGTDPVTSWALRGGLPEQDQVQRFPDYVQQVIAFMSREGAAVQIGARHHQLLATPRATSEPPVWLLGSSDYSARLAARLGLPYVFAHHFSGRGTAEALELYHSAWSGDGEPTTFLTVNAVIGDTTDHARQLALPFQHMMANLQRPGPLTRHSLLTVEEAQAARVPLPQGTFDAITDSWLIGTAQDVADGTRALAERFGVTEVMIQPVAGAHADEPRDRDLHRERTVAELLAILHDQQPADATDLAPY